MIVFVMAYPCRALHEIEIAFQIPSPFGSEKPGHEGRVEYNQRDTRARSLSGDIQLVQMLCNRFEIYSEILVFGALSKSMP
jgi:hypothetical protein